MSVEARGLEVVIEALKLLAFSRVLSGLRRIERLGLIRY